MTMAGETIVTFQNPWKITVRFQFSGWTPKKNHSEPSKPMRSLWNPRKCPLLHHESPHVFPDYYHHVSVSIIILYHFISQRIHHLSNIYQNHHINIYKLWITFNKIHTGTSQLTTIKSPLNLHKHCWTSAKIIVNHHTFARINHSESP